MEWIDIKGLKFKEYQVIPYNGELELAVFDTLWYGLRQCFIDAILCLLDRKAAKDHKYEV